MQRANDFVRCRGQHEHGVLSFGMDLLLGQQTGIRPTLALHANERSSFVVEGYYGGLFTKFGGSEGAGVRWVTTRGGPDAVTIGPDWTCSSISTTARRRCSHRPWTSPGDTHLREPRLAGARNQRRCRNRSQRPQWR